MTSKTFASGTVIDSAWLNDVDAATYDGAAVYMPAGTGAVATTVQIKLRESVSVKDFGVVGDGVTNDAVALQKAFDAIQSGACKSLDFCGLDISLGTTVYFPSNAKLIGAGATLRCPTTGFTNDGALSSLTALIANKSAIYTAGEAMDYGIEISGFTFVTGSNVAMDSIYLANTVGAVVRNNKFSYQQAGSYTLAHVDCHHSNIGTVVENNAFYHESITHAVGACVAFRNSNSLVPSKGLVCTKNYMYKNGTANADEFMWVNGGTGVMQGCKITHNVFESGLTDATSAMVTVYPFTGGGANAEAYDTVISSNTFNVPSNVTFAVLVGITGETRPSVNVVITDNTFNLDGNNAVKWLTNTYGCVVSNNMCRSIGASAFIAGDAPFAATETLIARGNTLIGTYDVAFFGGFVLDNYCETCRIFAYDTKHVKNNTVKKVTYEFVYVESVADVVIENNEFSMQDVTAGSFPYAFYLANGASKYDVKDNIVRFKTNGFAILRCGVSAVAAADVNFSGNRLYKQGATDTPEFQTFTYPLGGSNDNWFYDRNSNNTPSSGFGVGGFAPAIGHTNFYNDVAAGASVTIGTITTAAGVKNIVATVT